MWSWVTSVWDAFSAAGNLISTGDADRVERYLHAGTEKFGVGSSEFTASRLRGLTNETICTVHPAKEYDF